jgi:hypothetical protein
MRKTAKQPAIARIWRSKTRRDRADEYEKYNYDVGIEPLIEKALGVQTLREDREHETEFVTISLQRVQILNSDFARKLRRIDRNLRSLGRTSRSPTTASASSTPASCRIVASTHLPAAGAVAFDAGVIHGFDDGPPGAG